LGISRIDDSKWQLARDTFINEINSISNEQENEKTRMNQPKFAVKIEAVNAQIPGTAIVRRPYQTELNKHKNIQLSIEIINDKPACNLIVFDKFITTALRPGKKEEITVAYEDSEDVKKWPSLIICILHSEYDDDNGYPSWFNICYQDEEKHNMVQSFKLQSYEGKKYYDIDGDPWES
jgi:hypothetical protein